MSVGAAAADASAEDGDSRELACDEKRLDFTMRVLSTTEEKDETTDFVGVSWSATRLATTFELNFEGELVEAEDGRSADRTAGERCGCAAEGFREREGDCGIVDCKVEVEVEGTRSPGRGREGDLREKTAFPTPVAAVAVTG